MNSFELSAISLPEPFRVLWRDTVVSSNDELKTLAEQGCPEGLILIAEQQTSGRGRRGAAWHSPRGENLTFSVLLRPTFSKKLWYLHSLVTGLAVAKSIDSFIPCSEIKWPNDVLIRQKKISGILIESGSDFVIIGIGLNVNSTVFPEHIDATSLKLETGKTIERADVFLKMIKNLASELTKIEDDYERLIQEISQRCALRGKEVSYILSDKIRRGLVRGIGSQGELLVERNGSLESIYQADEIRII